MKIENFGIQSNTVFLCEKDEGFSNMNELHTHNIHELYYLIDGTLNYFIEQNSYSVEKGNIIFIPAGTPHKTTLSNNRSRILLHFGSSYIIEDSIFKKAKAQNVYVLNQETQLYIEKLLDKIYYELNNEHLFSKSICSFTLNEILAILCRNQNLLQPKRIKNTAIYKAEEYIKANYSQNITLESIANYLGLSKNYFSKLFNEQNGMNISEYINIVRIQNAAKLLKSGNNSITDVAFKTGFADSNYFSTQFKKIKGTTPYQYYKRSNSKGHIDHK